MNVLTDPPRVRVIHRLFGLSKDARFEVEEFSRASNEWMVISIWPTLKGANGAKARYIRFKEAA